ncbi:MAG: four helix bundle protein [Ignavibacteria bacterium]|nr:four helix bundle protein [Ignavibacteria bacterium]
MQTKALNGFKENNTQYSITNDQYSIGKRKFNLEDRLVDFTCRMIDVVEALPDSRAGNYIAGQLIKSCNSPAFNYGEVQAAESRNDFIHKMKIVLKELKECRVALKIISRKEMIKPVKKLKDISKETEELIAIIAKSITTAKNNNEVNKLRIDH